MSNTGNKFVSDNEWMIRPCSIYEEEYKDCKSIRARFNQYFIFGELIDCTEWQRNYNECLKWSEKKDTDAAEKIINSEKLRAKERLQAHYSNNTWEKRTEPPEDWSKPLPDWMQKEYENTYLDLKSKELQTTMASVNDKLSNRTLCSIM